MSKTALRLILSGMAMTLLFTIVSLTLPQESVANKKAVAIEGMSYNVNSTLADNFTSLLGKKVSIITVSGMTFTGFVKEVGPHLIHLEKLEKKEYFDALIRIENICGIEALFRR